jgi:hypothetical protein
MTIRAASIQHCLIREGKVILQMLDDDGQIIAEAVLEPHEALSLSDELAAAVLPEDARAPAPVN